MQDTPLGVTQSEDSIDLREYLALFWQWAWLIALVTLISAAGAFLISRQMTPVYQASTTALVNEAPATKSTDYSAVMASERLTRTYAEMINKEPVLNEVIGELGLQMGAADLKEMVSVSSLRDTQLIQVAVESTDPVAAAAIANSLMEVFSRQIQAIQTDRFAQSKSSLEGQLADLDKQITQYAADAARASTEAEKDRLESKVAQYREIYSNLLQSYEQVRLSEAQTISSVVQIELAPVPTEPIRPKTMQNTLLAAVVGLLLASGAIVAREALDDTLKTPEDVTKHLGLPVLGVISHHEMEEGRLIAEQHPRSPVAEAFRTLRTNVQYAAVDRPIRTLLVTSAEPGEGKTTISANLAVVLAQSGRSTALVDCDFRRPSVHQRFGMGNQLGLSQLFFQPNGHLNGSYQVSPVDNLGIITTGHLPPNPAELLGSQRMTVILDQVHEKADLVVLDTPPTLAVTDAAVLASAVDGVLLVIKPGQTRASAARQAVELLRRVNARLVGVVLNNLDLKRSGYGYRYRYHYYRNYPSYRNYYSSEEPTVPVQKSKQKTQG